MSLLTGEEKEVTFTIDKQALSFYDDRKQAWVAEEGDFEVLIGARLVISRIRQCSILIIQFRMKKWFPHNLGYPYELG